MELGEISSYLPQILSFQFPVQSSLIIAGSLIDFVRLLPNLSEVRLIFEIESLKILKRILIYSSTSIFFKNLD